MDGGGGEGVRAGGVRPLWNAGAVPDRTVVPLPAMVWGAELVDDPGKFEDDEALLPEGDALPEPSAEPLWFDGVLPMLIRYHRLTSRRI